MEKLTIRATSLQAGEPKICVSLMGKTMPALVAEAEQAVSQQADLIEWRADYFKDLDDDRAIRSAAQALRSVLDVVPLIFTIRTKSEGGTAELAADRYARIIGIAAGLEAIDAVDVEIAQPNSEVLAKTVKETGAKLILSKHDFEKTPTLESLVLTLTTMLERGADLPKIAVMPQTSQDVLTLLQASEQFKTRFQVPFVAISMGQLGAISRVAGALFGSVMTFAALQNSSAPGQLPVNELRKLLATF